jgi:putative NADH-flavin reductase
MSLAAVPVEQVARRCALDDGAQLPAEVHGIPDTQIQTLPSSLRPAPGADRFVTDLSNVPAEIRDEVRAGAALITEDLPATPASLDWIFVSPALRFGAHAPSESLGRYELGDDVAVEPDTGGLISAADYALGIVDLIDKDAHHRAHVNLGNPV